MINHDYRAVLLDPLEVGVRADLYQEQVRIGLHTYSSGEGHKLFFFESEQEAKFTAYAKTRLPFDEEDAPSVFASELTFLADLCTRPGIVFALNGAERDLVCNIDQVRSSNEHRSLGHLLNDLSVLHPRSAVAILDKKRQQFDSVVDWGQKVR